MMYTEPCPNLSAYTENGTGCVRTGVCCRNCAKNKKYTKIFLFFPQSKTQDVVQNRFAAYYSEKFIIYKRVRVMYNKVTVKLGIVALEGIRSGMLS